MYEAGGEGAPVVFVHGGFPSLASTLDDFSQWNWTWEHDFAASFHFLWYDRRGCVSSQVGDIALCIAPLKGGRW